MVSKTSQSTAALGCDVGIWEWAAASLPVFKWAVIGGNHKMFPHCKQGKSVYLPYKGLNKVTVLNKLKIL